MVKKNPPTKTPAASNMQYKVSGQVLNSNNEPISGQEVLAANLDLKWAAIYKTVSSVKPLKANGGFDLLGSATTNADGYHEIAFINQMEESGVRPKQSTFVIVSRRASTEI
jgi:hypothetical protein